MAGRSSTHDPLLTLCTRQPCAESSCASHDVHDRRNCARRETGLVSVRSPGQARREEESEGRTRWAGEQAVAAAAASLGANARCGLVANGLGEPEADSSLQAETEELALRASRDGVSDLAADEEGPADGTHEIE